MVTRVATTPLSVDSELATGALASWEEERAGEEGLRAEWSERGVQIPGVTFRRYTTDGKSESTTSYHCFDTSERTSDAPACQHHRHSTVSRCVEGDT